MPAAADILNDPDIAQAYEDVRSDKSDTTWLILKVCGQLSVTSACSCMACVALVGRDGTIEGIRTCRLCPWDTLLVLSRDSCTKTHDDALEARSLVKALMYVGSMLLQHQTTSSWRLLAQETLPK